MSRDAPSRIAVEVVYATPGRQTLVGLEVAAGTTVAEAIALSGIREAHPEIGAVEWGVGIFGNPVSPERRLAAGDRVEIYRPLVADPKEARRRRAGAGRRGGGTRKS
jgi:putative ubiquitin-RnfH superfamily antitoxin RatB of RatAB toxin-antitoxin module